MLGLYFLGSALAFASINANVPLGTARTFAALGGSTVTSTGLSTLNGNVGVYPGTAITGFPPAVISNGAIYAGGPVAVQAQIDIGNAYNITATRPFNFNLTGQALGGRTLTPAVYAYFTGATLAGNLTLNGQGNPNSVFIFQIGTTLSVTAGARVILTNGASPCNIFWKVGSSATLGAATMFAGNLLAYTSITVVTGARSNGGLYARNGAVTLDSNRVDGPRNCPAVSAKRDAPQPRRRQVAN